MSSVFGLHEKALLLREQRAVMIASNLVNVDTPNYKARDIDFREILQQAQQQPTAGQLQQTHAQHLSGSQATTTTALKYRTPMAASFDGNTVDAQIEQAQYGENAVQYMASLNFINQRAGQILTALKGDM